MIDPEFLDAMPHTIGLQRVSGSSTDGYGTRRYSATVTPVQARIERILQNVKSPEGKDVVSQVTVFCPPFDLTATTSSRTSIEVGPTDRIMLPGGFHPLVTSSTAYLPPVINVSREYDETSLHHFEVYL